jgi:hypothetical protein
MNREADLPSCETGSPPFPLPPEFLPKVDHIVKVSALV